MALDLPLDKRDQMIQAAQSQQNRSPFASRIGPIKPSKQSAEGIQIGGDVGWAGEGTGCI